MVTSLKHSLRVLRRDPGFTAVAVCSMAIGIGATSAMFSFANALLLRPLPVMKPDSVASVSRVASTGSGSLGANLSLSYPDYVDLRDRNRSFEGLAAAAYSAFGFSREPSVQPQMKFGQYVSGNFFKVLGVEPPLGRGFRPDEDQAEGRDAVAVLGHDMWLSVFGGNPSVIGSKIRLNGVEFSVIGVAPEHFTGIDNMLRPALFVPIAMSPRLGRENTLHKRDVRWLTIKGRLKAGASIDQAQADIGIIASELERTYPQTDHDQKIKVQTTLQMRVEEDPVDTALLATLTVLSLCVLTVACANVAGLLLSRARARSREIAVRLAIGAGRGTLIRQLLLENLLISVAGGLAGIGIAELAADYFNHIPLPTDMPVVVNFPVDGSVLIFTLSVSLISTLAFGIVPALAVTRTSLVPALKAADADSGGKPRIWGRNVMVTGQVALSLILLIISAVLIQGFRAQLQQGPGFRTDRLFLTGMDTQLIHYSDAQSERFYQDLLNGARSARGVRSAALTSSVPLFGGDDSAGIVPEGYQLARGETALSVFNSYVSDGYFATLNIPLLQGRDFRESDKDKAPMVAVVNEHLAKHYWTNGDAVGKRFHLNTVSGPVVEIVGVAKMSKYFWISEPPLDFLYLPFRQHARTALTLVAGSEAIDASTIAPVVRGIIHGLDAGMPVFDVRTMEDFYEQRAVRTPNMIARIVAAMGVMGLVLAVVGLYGLVAYSVSRRTREIGIRMAIGANRGKVIWMVLNQGLKLGGVGVAAGLVVSILAVRALTANLWVATFDSVSPLIYIAIALPLLVITMVATYAPARRASRIDPIRALRDE
jgi:predicted permease